MCLENVLYIHAMYSESWPVEKQNVPLHCNVNPCHLIVAMDYSMDEWDILMDIRF